MDAPNPPLAVTLDGVTLRLGHRNVLSDVTLRIADHHFIGVLGPNGAGKTTLMRAILGLVPPAAGRVGVLGQAPSRGNPAIGYMPQLRQSAPPRLSGWDFVAAAARGHRWGLAHPNRADRSDVARVLALVGATALAHRPLPELSGGERQRLLLAQSLLGEPRLLLLDEPLISLDIHHQHGVIDLVRDLQRELGITVLFSAHDINPLLPALDQVLYLAGGHAAIGSTDEVITAATLSRLYGTAIDVVHVQGRIFVMAGGQPVDHAHHHH
jgi:zinc/manganese transport system ATP-binding protein